MVSILRNLIVACSLALACLAQTGSVCGQTYGQQVASPAASMQNYNSGVIIDHSSMSPDSWSAPATMSTPVVSVKAPSAELPRTIRVASKPVTPFQSATNNAFSPGRSQAGLSPSIPDLNATSTRKATNQIRSLIRQPEVDSENVKLLGNPENVVQAPFESAKRVGGLDGLSLETPQPSTLSNTPLPVFNNQSMLPQAITSATGKFDIDPTTNPVINSNLPSAGSPSTQVAPGRYPLGINGGLQTEASAIRVLPDNPSTTYQALTNETPVGSTNYPNYGVSSPGMSQPIFQQQPLTGSPTFRPDLGHRSPNPTFRGRDHDSGLKMDFEDKKKEYPGLGEILATGRYFGSASTLFLQPGFQNNSAITQFNSSAAAASFASSASFDFDYETAPRLRLGFESKFGPGVELDYFQFDQGSNVSSFTSNGRNSGQLSTGLFGPSDLTTLEAVNAGETLSAIHSIDVETFSIMFFKEIKFPISRLNGMFGFQYASIFQTLEGELTNAGGAVIGTLRSTSDLRAYGPKFKFEYYRPIGHTNLEFVTAFGGGLLFGERDQIVSNTGAPAVNRFGADEFVVLGDFYGGVQWKKLTAENRAYYVRLGVTHQSWIGGGTAVSAQDNFGLRGFSFEVGLNR